ncbi:uncharacterized protein EV422DRAFT_543779 [Fimicolochytrium jonesii]|uniref:uncharacterized protein n=1 Tax=Fimicolochytrium jonesii TaxID=1396493 RepID=UPI0022FE4C31|nr:uncharacterized protein EV422DRAFT_543779 [Fimicolochytrium jonesii]KAI8816976.1 hypothetical protein EV422DRAFT_543779 [Fimicolochytrium jonesii]
MPKKAIAKPTTRKLPAGKGRAPARKPAKKPPVSYDSTDSDGVSDGEKEDEGGQSQGLSELLGLFQAQFKKQSTKRAKKSMSKHDVTLAAKMAEIQKRIAETEKERTHQIESTTRKYDAIWLHQDTQLKSFREHYHSVLCGWSTTIELLALHTEEVRKADRVVVQEMGDECEANIAQATHKMKQIEKDVEGSRGAVVEMTKAAFDTDRVKNALNLLISS